MVPRVGIEPTHLAVRDFKSLVSTISPPGQGSNQDSTVIEKVKVTEGNIFIKNPVCYYGYDCYSKTIISLSLLSQAFYFEIFDILSLT